MTDRRWTVMVIPHGSDAPRTVAVTERTLRNLRAGAVFVGLVSAVGMGSIVSTIADLRQPTPARTVGRAGTPPAELVAMRSRLETLRDTLEVIRTRESQIRLLAGLPSHDSVHRVSPDGAVQRAAATDTAARRGAAAPADVDAMLQKASALSERFAAVSDSLEQNAKRFASLPSIVPTAGWLTSHFTNKRKHPLLHITRPHEGIDVSAPMGTPIVAPADGVVRAAGRRSGYGLTLEIDHGNGIVTTYAHCSRLDVKAGERVTRGKTVAAVGNTGLSTGPHLHYEVRVNGKVVDPLTYVLPGAIPD